MLNKLKPKSEFARNVLTLMTGTTIAQAIPIAISPILTRLYTPEDFGVFALFMAISSILGTIATGRYELAIMLPKKDSDAINIFILGFLIVSFLSLFLLILVSFFNSFFASLLGNEKIGFYLYFVPISVFFIGLWNILYYFNNRKKNYKDLSKAMVVRASVGCGAQLGIGLIKSGAIGLVLGQVFAQMFAIMKLIYKLKIYFKNYKKSRKDIIKVAKRYSNFPRYSMASGFLNVSSYNIINIFISSFYNISTLGFYSLAQRVLGLPISLIGSSIGQVFLKEAIMEKQQTGKATKTFNATLKKLIIISLPIFFILFFSVRDLFIIVFGKKWEIAGYYAQILMPLYLFRFISSTLSSILIVYEKQNIELLINIALLTTSILSILLSKNFLSFLYIFSFFISFNYLLFIIYYRKLVGSKN